MHRKDGDNQIKREGETEREKKIIKRVVKGEKTKRERGKKKESKEKKE